VTFHGKPLVEETNLVINYGNRWVWYGLVSKSQSITLLMWLIEHCAIMYAYSILAQHDRN
jgi:hypothetical protein